MSRQGEARAELAQRIREIREQRGLDQARAAAGADVSPRSWSRYENESDVDPSYTTLARIAKALDVPAGALFGELTREQLGQLPTWQDRVEDRLDAILSLLRGDARQVAAGAAEQAGRRREPRHGSNGREERDPPGPSPES